MVEQQVPPKVIFLTSQDYNIFLLCRFGSGTHFINRTGSPLPSLPLGPPSVAPWASRLPASSPPQLPTHHQRWSCHPPPRWLSHSATSPSSFLVSSASCLKLKLFYSLGPPTISLTPPPPLPSSYPPYSSPLPTHSFPSLPCFGRRLQVLPWSMFPPVYRLPIPIAISLLFTLGSLV